MKCAFSNLKFKRGIVAAGLALLMGCKSTSYLESGTTPDRAGYGATAIDVPPAPVRHAVNLPPEKTNPVVEEVITGTWTFTTPPTVTRVEKRTADYHQFSLYMGRPEPTDKPFVVITVTRDRNSIAANDPATYKVSNQREYVLNGGVAQEWVGLTDVGAGFCEMIVRRPGADGQTGDVCHAIAVARTNEERTLALSILGSIVWTPSR